MAKKYNCPYCDYRNESNKLIRHIEKRHLEDLPEGYTPSRMVYDIRNKRTHGTCLICKQDTPWNENNDRYDSLCGRKECHDKYVSRFEKNMIRVYNKTRLLDDEEQQEKMLAHRRISGTYKFEDGGSHTYTGKFEEKALEFLDKVMHVKSKELMIPGPVLEYKDPNGVTRKYIPDIYWIDLNLLIEVKDGGSNPNNRNMPEYRAKQMAKEKMITNKGTFNYLRLTNNNFAQLLEIVAEIKEAVMNGDDKVIININENTVEEVGPVGGMPPNHTSSGYLIYKGFNGLSKVSDDDNNTNYSDSISSNQYLANDIISDKVVHRDHKGDVKVCKKKVLEDGELKIYRYLGDYNKFIEVASKTHLNESFYEALSGHKLYNLEQIADDALFEEVDFSQKINEITDEIISIKSVGEYNPVLPLLTKEDILEANSMLEALEDKLAIAEDKDGYFLYNKKTGRRTKSVKDIASLKPKIDNPVLLQEDLIYKKIDIPDMKFILEQDNGEYSDSDIDRAKEYCISTGYQLIYPVKSERELENMWDDYNSQNNDEKDDCNAASIRIFGKTCEQLYSVLKHKFLIRPSKDTYYGIYNGIREEAIPQLNKTIYSNSLVNNTFSFVSDMPYFTPDELQKIGFKPDDNIHQWYDEYNKLFKTGTVSSLFSKLNKERVEKLHKAKTDKEKLSLAWNPAVAFEPKIRVKIDKKINKEICHNILQEANIPIRFDKNGRLIIDKFWKNRYTQQETMYQELHSNLIKYEKAKNYKLMEFELVKMYDIYVQLEEEYTKQKSSPDRKIVNLRARVKNDMDKYLPMVLAHNKKFNIRRKYTNSTMNKDNVNIDPHTLKGYAKVFNTIKQMII